MSPFDYEAYEKAIAAYADTDFGPAIGGELPEFWKPEKEGEEMIGKIVAVRPTKDFGDHQGTALKVETAGGPISIPVSASLIDVDWPAQIGRVFKFAFLGWVETKGKPKNRFRNIKAFPERVPCPF